MTRGRVAPFFMPFHEVTFAVSYVGLDRAIEVGSWSECRQRFRHITVAIFHPVSHRSRSLSVQVSYLMPLSLSTRNLRSILTGMASPLKNLLLRDCVGSH
jgi:hypothetical protein